MSSAASRSATTGLVLMGGGARAAYQVGVLRALGRIHGPVEIAAAVDELIAAGLANFNLDLMYALPRQERAGAAADLAAAIALAPAHISHYQLTLEPGTVFHRRPPPLPDDDLAYDMQVDSEVRLAAAGYAHYEVSAYARPGRQCRHNLNYWRFGDYLGIGAGAHGKATVDGAVIRTEKPRSPRAYLQGGGRQGATRRAVFPAELPFEFMLNALRLTEGFALADFERTTGLSAAAVAPKLAGYAERGLVTTERGRYRTTTLGQRFLNDLLAGFLPDENARRSPAELYTAPSRFAPDRDFRHIVSEVR